MNSPKKAAYGHLYFLPDFVEMVGRYLLLMRQGIDDRASDFILNRLRVTSDSITVRVSFGLGGSCAAHSHKIGA